MRREAKVPGKDLERKEEERKAHATTVAGRDTLEINA